jgi:predicted transcriptional regulator
MYADSYLSQKVESIAEKNYVTLSEDTYVGEAAKVMPSNNFIKPDLPLAPTTIKSVF